MFDYGDRQLHKKKINDTQRKDKRNCKDEEMQRFYLQITIGEDKVAPFEWIFKSSAQCVH